MLIWTYKECDSLTSRHKITQEVLTCLQNQLINLLIMLIKHYTGKFSDQNIDYKYVKLINLTLRIFMYINIYTFIYIYKYIYIYINIHLYIYIYIYIINLTLHILQLVLQSVV